MNNRVSFGHIDVYQIESKKKEDQTCFEYFKSLFMSKGYYHNMKPDYDIKPKRSHIQPYHPSNSLKRY